MLVALAVCPRLMSAQASALDLVRQLYATYAWETSDAEMAKHTPFFSEQKAVIARYLDAPLLRAVLRNRACEQRTGEICNLDFDPMWDSQDPGGVTVEVVSTRASTAVQARVHYPSDSTIRVVTYRLRKTPGGWRITDMKGAGWPSLLALLRSP